eukprot:3899098-Amphidinium_carterae.1
MDWGDGLPIVHAKLRSTRTMHGGASFELYGTDGFRDGMALGVSWKDTHDMRRWCMQNFEHEILRRAFCRYWHMSKSLIAVLMIMWRILRVVLLGMDNGKCTRDSEVHCCKPDVVWERIRTSRSTASMVTHDKRICLQFARTRVVKKVHRKNVTRVAHRWKIQWAMARSKSTTRIDAGGSMNGIKFPVWNAQEEAEVLSRCSMQCAQTPEIFGQYGHTTGDGNCAWRAVFKSVGRSQDDVTKGSNWKRLEKIIITSALERSFSSQVQEKIRVMKRMGVWSNRVTFILVAAFAQNVVKVDTEQGTWAFEGRGAVTDGACTRLAIRDGHCMHVLSIDDGRRRVGRSCVKEGRGQDHFKSAGRKN